MECVLDVLHGIVISLLLNKNDADIPNSVVPNMQSLPQEAKKLIRTKKFGI